MRRREFIGLLGGVAGALTCADVFAAQKSRIARIGGLNVSRPEVPECCATSECKSVRSDSSQNPDCWIGYVECAWLARRRECIDRVTLGLR